MRHFRCWLRCLTGLAIALNVAAAQAQRISVVASDETPAFQEAVHVLVEEFARGGLSVNDVRSNHLNAPSHLEPWPEETRVIVTLGARAFAQVMADNPHAAVIAALIPRMGFERIVSQLARKTPLNVSALYLDQPFARQLALVRLVLPSAKFLGVIWGPESGGQRSQLAANAKSMGFVLHEGSVEHAEPLIGALRSALGDTDVLLAVPDAQVYNAATVSDILLTTYRAHIPVIAFSPSYAKAGAVVSLYTSPSQVGLQAASMAMATLQSGMPPPSQYPNDFSIAVNEYVARSLGMAVDTRHLTVQIISQEKHP